jgi:hypothetical protein
MEQHENHVTLIGVPIGPQEFSHSNHGRRFYRFPLEVNRLSGAVDTLCRRCFAQRNPCTLQK